MTRKFSTQTIVVGYPIAYHPLFGDPGSSGIGPKDGDCYPGGWISSEYDI